MVHIHGAGGDEKYSVDLLEEEPDVPSAREMLHIIAKDPVAQARFFIISMRLFCEHVLGTGPIDALFRHNGTMDGPAFPDGFAASGLRGCLWHGAKGWGGRAPYPCSGYAPCGEL